MPSRGRTITWFPHVEIAGRRHPHLVLQWSDITGESGWVSREEFLNFQCAKMSTSAYLYDVFEKEGQRFVRLFASFEREEESFGDRNCLPWHVLTTASQDLVEIALIFQRGNVPPLP